MSLKSESLFYLFYGNIIIILQLGMMMACADFCEDTFTIYQNKTITISTDATIHNVESSTKCAAECRSRGRCCAAVYSQTSMVCHLDISGDCSSEKSSVAGWVTMTKDYFDLPRDCSDVRSGNDVYQIYPNTSDPNCFDVYCEIGSDGNAWTVIQRRIDGQTDFYRGWSDYEVGFGDLRKEFWLGNDNIHRLTEHNAYILRIELEHYENGTRYAEYQSFKIGNAESNYTLHISGYSGNAGDSLIGHNGKKFSTKDQDNDTWSGKSCATAYYGGWWYGKCHSANLNGKYLGGSHLSYADGIEWHAWTGYQYSLKSTTMMIRRK